MARQTDTRIAVTGIGVVTPCGTGPEELWSAVREGRSAAGPIEGFDVSGLGGRIGCQIRDFDPLLYLEPKQARRMDRSCQLAVAAALLAWRDAGLDDNRPDPDRLGINEGTSLGGADWLFRTYDVYLEKGLSRVNPFAINAAFIGAASGEVAIHLGVRGPCQTICTGSASGSDAIGLGMRSLLYGDVDVVIAGGSEAPFVLPIVALFNRVGVLSKMNDAPGSAFRPFDAGRDGFVLGEGAAFLVMEKEERARARGARIRCILGGYGQTSDAYHMVAPHPDGEGAAAAIRRCLNEAGLESEQVDYINAHGTATQQNDSSEARGIVSALGPWGEEVLVSSTKPVTGHLLGAAGALEAVITILAIEHQTAPPNINLVRQDTACPLNLVSPLARETDIEAAISNSYGFGGKNSSLLFLRYHP